MAGKILTLKNAVKFIESKHGEQIVTVQEIANSQVESHVVYIHDAGTTCPVAKMSGPDNDLVFENESEHVHCILLETDLFDFSSENPYMLLTGAVNGIFVVDDNCVSIEEIEPYATEE